MWERAQGVRATSLALRRLQRAPVRTGLNIAVLAAGISAAATMLTVVDAVDFRPLPYREAGSLVVLHEVAPATYKWCRDCGVSPATFQDWQKSLTAVDGLSAEATYSRRWLHDNVTEEVITADVSPSLFGVLGVVPAIGRPLTAADTESGAAPVAVISDALWHRGFAADPRITERHLDVISRITRQRQSYSIVGVMPPRFRLFVAEAWMPLTLAKGDARSARTLQVIGRLRPGATLRTLDPQLRSLAARAASLYPATNSAWSARAISIRDATIQDFGLIASARWLLLSVVACLLAITLGSVVTVLKAEAGVRAPELALRTILGASRGQIAGLLALDGIFIAVLAGAVAVMGTTWGISLSAPALGLTRLDPHVGFDGRSASFLIASTILCVIACGVAPLGEAFHLNIADATRNGGAVVLTGRTKRVRSSLIIANVAATVVLGYAAALAAGGLYHVERHELGYDPHGLFLVMLRTQGQLAPDAERAMCRRSADRLGRLPEITLASCSAFPTRPLQIRLPSDREPVPSDLLPVIQSVSSGFFTTAGIPIRRGRSFGSQDGAGTSPVAIVSEGLATRLGGGQAAVGHTLLVGDGDSAQIVSVVGVAGDSKLTAASALGDARPVLYRPFEQAPEQQLTVFVRAPRATAELQRSVLAALHDLSVGPPDRRDVRSMSDLVSSDLAQQRFNRSLLLLFAALALALGVAGLYSMVRHMATLRAREVAIRLALGDTPISTAVRIASDGLVHAAAGIAIGFLISAGVSRILSSLLAANTSVEASVASAALAILLASALAACLLPAVGVSTKDPASVLREDGFRMT